MLRKLSSRPPLGLPVLVWYGLLYIHGARNVQQASLKGAFQHDLTQLGALKWCVPSLKHLGAGAVNRAAIVRANFRSTETGKTLIIWGGLKWATYYKYYWFLQYVCTVFSGTISECTGFKNAKYTCTAVRYVLVRVPDCTPTPKVHMNSHYNI